MSVSPDEADRAGDRRIVDQAARRGLALERRGIGRRHDVDDVGAGEGEVAARRTVSRIAPAGMVSVRVPSWVTPESVRSIDCEVSGTALTTVPWLSWKSLVLIVEGSKALLNWTTRSVTGAVRTEPTGGLVAVTWSWIWT